jgi:hypothetical protein
MTPAPKPGPLQKAEAMALIGKFRSREVRYVQCGNRLIKLYEAH